MTDRLTAWIAARRLAVVVAALLTTAALAVPLLAMAPTGFASQEPEGPAFTARDTLEERFGAGTVAWFFIVEDRDGEILDADGLREVAARADALRTDPDLAPLLVERSDGVGGSLLGARSFADVVDGVLTGTGAGGLAEADDAVIRQVASSIVEAEGTADLGVSVLAARAEDGTWSAPALTLSVVADASRIEGRGADGGLGSDAAVEATGRRVQAVLRDGDALDVWGVALDQNLTGEEQGEAAGPFIGFTVLAIVALVGLVFRSYWTLAVVGGALAALLVWLQGIANLIGLEQDQILSTVVPIAMISFGADYAFHAVGRYREQRSTGDVPVVALGRGLRAVLPALLLALLTGVVAFLANTTSGIESITQFGVAAALALVSAFLVLGVVVPAAIALIEERVRGRRVRGRRVLAVGGGIAAASMVMTTVLFIVFLSPPVGLGLLAGYLVVFLVIPVALAGRRPVTAGMGAEPIRAIGQGAVAALLGRIVTEVAARRIIVLPVVAVLSIGAAVLAVQVPASFDVEDFFAADTDFVMGLDKLDEHVGAQGGEEAVVLVETDLDDPAAVAAVRAFADEVTAVDTPLLARAGDGGVAVDRSALDLLDGTSPLAEAEAARVLARDGDGDSDALRLSVGLVGSRAQENVEATRALLEPMVADLEARLTEVEEGSRATLTGGPIVRQASLDAVSRSLQRSLPIAVLLCLLVAWAAMRSLRHALVSLAPIVLVVAWLYGFMQVAGYSINLVTATIGAISIGVGIDFAIHLTMRYRQELPAGPTRLAALDRTVAGTGVALVGSTVSSVVGFAILALAPMPLFASYGLLTAVMIGLALLATLLVLPGLLLIVSREPALTVPPDRSSRDLASTG